jgi:exopolysaccharide biosynthesis predicted pyruvyltransferase EpsI
MPAASQPTGTSSSPAIPPDGPLAFLREAAERIERTLLPLIPARTPIAIFDFPDHPNVGDSAIWLGTMAFLRRHRLGPVLWIDTIYRGRGDHVLPDLPFPCTLLINGGGNLGDLWETNQRYREAVISHYPDHRIIQLPQSVLFESADSDRQWIEVCHSHGDLHVIVRDADSRERCGHLPFNRLHLCPDMALYLGQLSRPCQPVADIVHLLRTDKERASQEPGASSEPSQDWMEESDSVLLQELLSLQEFQGRLTHRGARLQRLRTGLLRIDQRIGLFRLSGDPLTAYLRHRQRMYHLVASERLGRGCRLLARGQVVITDRLHAHLLCLMMAIPHVYLDNSYGKISAFSRTWMTQSERFRPANDLAAAGTIARELLARVEKTSVGRVDD